nr:selenide, water dikinase SelD [candidate division Zixibacteria bacterium]NIT73637.1 selenide, water dikinase SelD [candidate division KSB1 bacterium]NIW47458.1 selenide, water dikinase SelD [Gammaproteobacteria bacterium]NIS47929.1 selenide, water dikinase SelD [candidate division Zixibacteria bacterium]NIU16037.1 selenide, water dikinase SelD [candidate division Zixibacteria bacterium]
AKPGDVLILTKPIGSGVLFNANLKNWVSKEAMKECVDIITTLNRSAAEVLANFDVHAVTDVTGFGLAGHSFEMARGSRISFVINIDEVPIMNEALEMYKKGMNTGTNRFNRQLVQDHLRFEKELPTWHQEIFFDPQTSGGLLIAVSEEYGLQVLEALRQAKVKHARIIGKVNALENSTHLIFR